MRPDEEDGMATSTQTLERNAIGLTEVLFQSITHMAPAVAVALSIGFATGAAGGNTPLAVVLALVACLFTAFSIGELAKHLPSAGGMYTYVGNGLGSFAGWLMAWAFLLAEPLVAPILFAAFGFYGSSLLDQLFGIKSDILWLPLAVLCAAIVWFLTYRGISISTRTGVVLGSIEIIIFVAVSALLIVNAGGKNTVSVFVPGSDGLKPALQGMVFCLLAFVGFEAAAPLGEEARDPKRTIRQAVIYSCIAIGIFYTFCYYAATVFFGPENMTGFISANDGNPWGGMADQVLPGIGSLLVTFAILNSCLANASSGATAATRAIFALGRGGLIPRLFAAIHPAYRTPTNAVHAQALFGIVLAVALSLWLGSAYPGTPGPLNTYFFLGYALGLLFAGMYMAVNAATFGYYWRVRRDEFSWVRHGLVPLIGFILMIPAFISTLGGIYIPIADFTPTQLSEPYSFVPPIVAIWIVAGIIIGIVLRGRNPERMSALGEAVAEA
jgi:amino acid transporter